MSTFIFIYIVISDHQEKEPRDIGGLLISVIDEGERSRLYRHQTIQAVIKLSSTEFISKIHITQIAIVASDAGMHLM